MNTRIYGNFRKLSSFLLIVVIIGGAVNLGAISIVFANPSFSAGDKIGSVTVGVQSPETIKSGETATFIVTIYRESERAKMVHLMHICPSSVFPLG